MNKDKKLDNKSSENKSSFTTRRAKKMSEYGKQLNEKQKVKQMYGMQEKQFKRFFGIAANSRQGTPGENLLGLLERRLDNTLYRLKFACSRLQARQIIVHGHILVNDKKVYSPSYLVSVNDIVSLASNVLDKKVFVETAIAKRMSIGIKVPEWLELNKQNYTGMVLRNPVAADIQAQMEMHLIVELYSR